MPKTKNNETTTFIIIIESDETKHTTLKNQFDKAEGAVLLKICNNAEQAITLLKKGITPRIIPLMPPPNTIENLTKREKEVLQQLAKGQLYKEIAQTLNITLGSLKQYIHIIYKKLGVHNRTEAINAYFGQQKGSSFDQEP